MLQLITVAGARPNFVKIAPLQKAFERHGSLTSRLVNTGQHYDRVLSGLFFEQLGIPEPDISLGVGSGTHAQQTAAVMSAIEPVLLSERPDAVVIVGDVNSTVAVALAAVKCHIPVVHVEAGLRSGDRLMPEEINRIVTDSISDLCLVTETAALEFLAREGVPSERVVMTGNVMIDALDSALPAARAIDQAAALGLEPGRYIVVTLHRPETVDHADRLSRALDHLEAAAQSAPVVLPLHPRTRARLEELGLMERARSIHGLRLESPLGYLEFLSLTATAGLVVTDSGGIQEETTALGIPCITLRDSTERPVTVDVGTNVLRPVSGEIIGDLAREALEGRWKKGRRPDLWDGHAAERVAEAIAELIPRLGRR